jgi:hypothetical protein
VRYSFVKDQARDLRELAVSGPNFEPTAVAYYVSTFYLACEQEAEKTPTRSGLAMQSVCGD